MRYAGEALGGESRGTAPGNIFIRRCRSRRRRRPVSMVCCLASHGAAEGSRVSSRTRSLHELGGWRVLRCAAGGAGVGAAMAAAWAPAPASRPPPAAAPTCDRRSCALAGGRLCEPALLLAGRALAQHPPQPLPGRSTTSTRASQTEGSGEAGATERLGREQWRTVGAGPSRSGRSWAAPENRRRRSRANGHSPGRRRGRWAPAPPATAFPSASHAVGQQHLQGKGLDSAGGACCRAAGAASARP